MPTVPELSVALLTHNERVQLTWLMEVLAPAMAPDWELVILDDYSDAAMVDLVRGHATTFAQRRLNRNFSAQRNHLKSLCKGRFILALDPDELPDPGLLAALPHILAVMERESLDVVEVPRLSSIVAGNGPVDPRAMRFTEHDLRACVPAHQSRILRNVPHIRYVNRVHERLIGPRRVGRLPLALRYALYHVKTEANYVASNRFYRSIRLRYVDKWRKSLAKRLGMLAPPERLEIDAGDLGLPPAEDAATRWGGERSASAEPVRLEIQRRRG